MSHYDREFRLLDVTDALWDAAMLVRAWYRLPGNDVGGALHVVVDDNNVEDRNIQFCIDDVDSWYHNWHHEPDRIPFAEYKAKMLAVANALLALDETERLLATGCLAAQYSPEEPRRPSRVMVARYSDPYDGDWDDEDWHYWAWLYPGPVERAPMIVLEAIAEYISNSVDDRAENCTGGKTRLRIAVSVEIAKLMLEATGGRDLSSWATAWWAAIGDGTSTMTVEVVIAPAAELQGHPATIMHVDDPIPGIAPPEATWEHDGVFARYPKGTDPLAAIRDAMGVFMERSDGTNALEWWQQIRWYHGGRHGLKRGDVLLPPSQTGVLPGMPDYDHDSVYITSSRKDAIMYAIRFESPVLYEVTITVEPTFDDVLPTLDTSKRVPSAKVWKAELPSRAEIGTAWKELHG